MDGSPPPKNSGAPNGPSRRRPFNRWFRYPAGFADDLKEALLSPLSGLGPATDRPRVLDPFAGTATLAPWLSLNGYTFVGIEAHPLVAQIANLKSGPWPQPELLKAAAMEALQIQPKVPAIDDEHPMVKKCFSDEVLRALVRLRTAIQTQELPLRGWLQLALVATLRDVSTSHVGWPYQRPNTPSRARFNDAAERFLERVQWIASDISLRDSNGRPPRTLGWVLRGDSRDIRSFHQALGEGELADVCITSPPYLNNYDYADATRLELYFLGKADSWASMCRYARDGMVVASTQQTSQQRAELSRQRLIKSSAGAQLKELVNDLRDAASERPRPKEYDRLVLEYFSDMMQVLANIRSSIKTDAQTVLAIADSALYGVHIETPRLLAELARDAGFSLLDLTMHRSRGHRWKDHPQRSSVQLGEYVLRLKADREVSSAVYE